MKTAADGAVSWIEISKRGVTRTLVATVIALHLLNLPAVAFRYAWPWEGARHYIAFFSVAGEGKLPTFYSGVTLLAAAALLGLIAAHERRQGGFRLHWAGLGAIFAAMAMDELVVIHEHSSGVVRSFLAITGGPLYHAWVVPAMVFLAVLGIAYFRFLAALPVRSRALFVVAGLIYTAGVLGMEMAGAAYTAAHGLDLVYGALSTIEEILEMTGIVVFLYGLMDHIERNCPESRIRVVG